MSWFWGCKFQEQKWPYHCRMCWCPCHDWLDSIAATYLYNLKICQEYLWFAALIWLPMRDYCHHHLWAHHIWGSKNSKKPCKGTVAGMATGWRRSSLITPTLLLGWMKGVVPSSVYQHFSFQLSLSVTLVNYAWPGENSCCQGGSCQQVWLGGCV